MASKDNPDEMLIRQSIRRAFSKEAESCLIEAELRRLASETAYEDSRALYNDLAGKTWHDLSESDATSADPWLILLPPEILQHFLPGLMILALSENASGEFIVGLIDSLCPPSSLQGEQKIGVNLSLLSQDQRNCLATFLTWCQHEPFHDSPRVQRRCRRAIDRIEEF